MGHKNKILPRWAHFSWYNWAFLFPFLVIFLSKDVMFLQPLSHDAFNPFELKNSLPPHRILQERVFPFSFPERKHEGNLSTSFHYLMEWGIHVEDQSCCFSKENSERARGNTMELQEGTFQFLVIKKKKSLLFWWMIKYRFLKHHQCLV